MKSWIMRALIVALVAILASAAIVQAQESHPSANPNLAPMESKNAPAPAEARTEANLVLPDLSSVSFLGVNGHSLLLGGVVVCLLGGVFGLVIFFQLRNLE